MWYRYLDKEASQKEKIEVTSKLESEYIELFDSEGNEVPLPRETLLLVEGRWFREEGFYEGLAGLDVGTYWLISDRPECIAMLLKMQVWHGQEISFQTSGVASFPHWDRERILKDYAAPWLGSATPIPENVAELTRAHVAYRPGRDPGDRRVRNGIQTVDAAELRRRIDEFTEHTEIDPTTLLRAVAGKRVLIMELALAVTDFCAENDLEDSCADVLVLTVPEDQQERLIEMYERLARTFESE